MKKFLALLLTGALLVSPVYANDANSSASVTETTTTTTQPATTETKVDSLQAVPISQPTSVSTPTTTSKTSTTSTSTNTHTVISGDTLKDIAKKYGLTLENLVKLNPQIKNINLILVGEKINIALAENTASNSQTSTTDTTTVVNAYYPDGTYRGVFVDSNEQQVGVQFTLENGKVKTASYRVLAYKGVDYRKSEDAKVKALLNQYTELLEATIGKTVDEAIKTLGSPATVSKDVQVETDSFTSATLRAPKIRAAFKDALNKGLYTLKTSQYDNGTYRGQFIDGGKEQVSVNFEITDGKITKASYRTLAYRDANYLADTATQKEKNIRKQYEQALGLLVGKDLKSINILDYPAVIVSDEGTGEDAVTGATLRLNKVKVAIQDGLNKGVYTPASGTTPSTTRYENQPDGTYRGVFTDRNTQQVGITFTLKSGVVEKISYRLLGYRGTDYLTSEDPKVVAMKNQYNQLIEYLVGKKLTSTTDLYKPANIAKDDTVGTDTVTGATLRASKVISAINDALLKGVYSNK